MSALDLDRRTISDALDVMAHGRATCDRSRLVRDYASGRVTYNIAAREIYSYGTHFPLLRFVPRGRRRPLIVLNGDVWRNGGGPSRTADHQQMARELAAPLGETVVIPFSALEGAGIALDSIRPVVTRDDAVWQETVTRAPAQTPDHRKRAYNLEAEAYEPVPPDPDGFYRWDETRHRLGDCVFSGVREESYFRATRPFEVSGETGRVTIEVAWRDSYCGAREKSDPQGYDRHEPGPSGACIHCGRELETRVTVRRRARYLSSFDYNEAPPLYFLAELPRGAAVDTVDDAIESLAPRSVHAARARSIPVERQGDVFFIRTGLELADLERRGIRSRARLTQWTRDARARMGEVGYVPPLDAAGRRRMARYRRAEWRRIFRDASGKITAPRPLESFDALMARKVQRARDWRTLQVRHTLELELAAAAGLSRVDPLSAPCECGAPIGATCSRYCYNRRSLAEKHTRELEGYRNGRHGPVILPGPDSPRGARRKWREARERHALELERARAELRALVFGRAPRYRSSYSRYYGRRRELADRVKQARADLHELESRGPAIAAGRAIARDAYRAPFKSPVAAAAWRMAGAGARAKFYPSEWYGPTIQRRRERVRRALAIYGTAHSATEVIRTRAGATYVRGAVRHVPELEPGRVGPADHRPLELESDVWYLAVRNTVPRQRRARRV